MSRYGHGEAWAIVRPHACLVLDRDLTGERARALHEVLEGVDDLDAALDLVRDEPLALVVAVRDGDRWRMARTRGVPAQVGDERRGPAPTDGWIRDEGAGIVLVGDISADADLPVADAVVRVRVMAWGVESAPRERATVSTSDEDVFEDTVLTPPRRSDAPPVPAHARLPGPAQAPATAPSTTPPLLPPPPASAPASASASVPPAAGAMGLIDSVPGFIRPATDQLARQSPEPAPEASSPPTADAGLGDHDGMTISAAEARALAARSAGAPRPATVAPAEAEPATGPLVLSTMCPAGHVQPTGTERCARCGAPIDPATASRRARPEFAELVLASGERIPLGRGVVLGRRPRSGRVEDGRVPRLVAVESPNEDISRSHLEVRFDDWTLVATDLDSTNGTILLREGADPVRMRPGVATIVALGDRLDLGDGVVVTIDPTSTSSTSSQGAPA